MKEIGNHGTKFWSVVFPRSCIPKMMFVFLKDLFLYSNHRVCPNLGSITFGEEDLGQFLKTVVVNLLPLSNSNKENLVMIYHGLLLWEAATEGVL